MKQMMLCYLLLLLGTWNCVSANPSIGQAEDTCVYSFQVPRQDSHAACSDSVSLDQQLLKTMVLSLQRQVTELQQQISSHGDNLMMPSRNIQQCSWVAINEEKEDGQIKTCTFSKKSDSTILRVVWNGDMRLIRSSGANVACRRWFFTLNGQECSSPASIDTQLHTQDFENNMHRPGYLEGLCRDVSAGNVHVTFNVGDCLNQAGYHKGDAYTGWTSTSRIIVEELDVQEPTHIG